MRAFSAVSGTTAPRVASAGAAAGSACAAAASAAASLASPRAPVPPALQFIEGCLYGRLEGYSRPVHDADDEGEAQAPEKRLKPYAEAAFNRMESAEEVALYIREGPPRCRPESQMFCGKRENQVHEYYR